MVAELQGRDKGVLNSIRPDLKAISTFFNNVFPLRPNYILMIDSGGVREIDGQTGFGEYGAQDLVEALSEASDTGSGKTVKRI